MNFATSLRTRNSERFIALLATIGVLMSLMVIYAQPALAHHPETAAESSCDLESGDTTLKLTSTSWTFSTSEYGNHDEVKIQASTDDSTWFDVTTGAYEEPSRTFDTSLSGTDAIAGTTVEDLEGSTLYVRSWVIDQPVAGAGWYRWDPFGDTNGSKDYNENSGTGNPNAANKTSIAIPECDEPEKESVSVTVTAGACELRDNQPPPGGPVTVTINPDGNATVKIYFDAGLQDQVGNDITASGEILLPPGTYYWDATAGDGFEMEGPSSGQFTIADCAIEVIVTHGNCEISEGEGGFEPGSGFVSVIINPDSGASVTVTGPGGPFVFSESGSVELAPGSYAWIATAADGFEFDEGFTPNGEFEVIDCSALIIEKLIIDFDSDSHGDVEFGFTSPDLDAVFGGEGTVVQLGHGDSEGGPVSPGQYEIFESDVPEGWSLIGVSCDDDDSGMNETGDGAVFNVETGETVKCTFSNLEDEVAASILVTVGGECVATNGVGAGEITVTVSVDDGATVVIKSGNTVVETLTSDGEVTVPEGQIYSWEATANEGFEFPVGFDPDGTVSIENCSEEQLPLTGFESSELIGISILLLGVGALMVFASRRSEEG